MRLVDITPGGFANCWSGKITPVELADGQRHARFRPL